MSGRAKTGNEGIQATNVVADVLAVGRGAAATKYGGTAEAQLREAVQQLRGAIAGLELEPATATPIRAELELLEAADLGTSAGRERTTTILGRMMDTLKKAGLGVTQFGEVVDAATKIAAALKVPLAVIGL
jgi:hypothetical protein